MTGPTAQAHLEQRERALAGTTLRLSQVPPSAPRPVLSCPPPPSLEKHAPCSAVLLPFSRQHSCHRMYLSHHLSEQTSFHKQLCGKQVNPRSCLWRPRPPPPCLALSAPGGAPLFKPSTAAAHKESAVPLSLRMRRLAQNCCLTSFHSPVLLWTRCPFPALPSVKLQSDSLRPWGLLWHASYSPHPRPAVDVPVTESTEWHLDPGGTKRWQFLCFSPDPRKQELCCATLTLGRVKGGPAEGWGSRSRPTALQPTRALGAGGSFCCSAETYGCI